MSENAGIWVLSSSPCPGAIARLAPNTDAFRFGLQRSCCPLTPSVLVRLPIFAVAVALLAWPDSAHSSSTRSTPRTQSQTNYVISATLDPLRNKIIGRESIHLTNTGSRPLAELMMCEGFTGAIRLDSLEVAGKPAEHTIGGARMRVALRSSIAPGASVDVTAVWTVVVPTQGGAQMAHDGPLYQVGDWYPRPCAYDNASGWLAPGAGRDEPSDFDVSITVPFSYIVRATGELQNPGAVLTPTEISRLAIARTSDTTVHVVTSRELSDFTVFRPVTDGDLTWHFTAHGTPDFAWATGPDFLWDASGWNGILIETLYRRTTANWADANRGARDALKALSTRGHPYPWAHVITIEGPLTGVEFPMLVFGATPTRLYMNIYK